MESSISNIIVWTGYITEHISTHELIRVTTISTTCTIITMILAIRTFPIAIPCPTDQIIPERTDLSYDTLSTSH